ncbi:MAG: inosine monophosphate cyclohydrolase [candidate division Zixibacteria bacterium]|nr:inosine monophosphate cyclohydrolase [candidate division Zixibacteria bacterium]
MQPEDRFERHIARNPYPGRGLLIGRSETGNDWLIVYWIMGRSDHSRNRKFVVAGTTLRTEPVDAAQVKDPSLIIYEAMLEHPGVYMVSNGDQTRTIHDALQVGSTFEAALATREREPDAPNYTPRISAMLDFRNGDPVLVLSLLKANPFNPAHTDRTTFRPASPPPGYGVGLTTYMGDGTPLPAYTGDPLSLPCRGSANDVLETYWQALDTQNRIALAVKKIDPESGNSTIIVKPR